MNHCTHLSSIEIHSNNGSQVSYRFEAFHKEFNGTTATCAHHRKRVAERMGRVSGNDESRMAVVCKLHLHENSCKQCQCRCHHLGRISDASLK